MLVVGWFGRWIVELLSCYLAVCLSCRVVVSLPCGLAVLLFAVIGKTSNTMIFNDKPADVNALLAQASSVINAAGAGASPGADKALPK